MEFNITYAPQKAIKGQGLADLLAAHPIPDDSPLNFTFPDEETLCANEEEESEWQMFFDSIRPTTPKELPRIRAGIGLVFVTPQKGIIRHSIALTDPCTNNEAEYEALIAGLEMAQEMEIKKLKVRGDSQLVLNQMEGKYQVCKPELIEYQKRALELITTIPEVTFEKVSHASNGITDALARVAKELSEPGKNDVQIIVRNRGNLCPITIKEVHHVSENEIQWDLLEDPDEENNGSGDRKQPFEDFFKGRGLPKNKAEREQFKKRVLRYVYVNRTLYRRSYDQIWLRCVTQEEASKIMKEVHAGICGGISIRAKNEALYQKNGILLAYHDRGL